MNKAGAFFLAPMPAACAGGVVSWASGGWPRPVSVIVFYLLLLYAAQLLFGLAIRAWLLRKGEGTAARYALGGVAMVALPAVPYVLWGVARRPEQAESAPFVLGLWLLMGALAGLTAWLLARPKAAAAHRF